MIKEKQHWNSFGSDEDLTKAVWFDSDKKIDECLNMIIPSLAHHLTDRFATVFDLGCGVGRLLHPFAEKHESIHFVGIDFSEKMIEVAERKSLQNVRYCLNDGLTIPFTDNCLDAGYSMIMFQHIPRPNFAGYLKEVSRVLKEGGTFRFQFVEGTEDVFLSHHLTLREVRAYIEAAGLRCTAVDNGIYDVWKWITVKK